MKGKETFELVHHSFGTFIALSQSNQIIILQSKYTSILNKITFKTKDVDRRILVNVIAIISNRPHVHLRTVRFFIYNIVAGLTTRRVRGNKLNVEQRNDGDMFPVRGPLDSTSSLSLKSCFPRPTINTLPSSLSGMAFVLSSFRSVFRREGSAEARTKREKQKFHANRRTYTSIVRSFVRSKRSNIPPNLPAIETVTVVVTKTN